MINRFSKDPVKSTRSMEQLIRNKVMNRPEITASEVKNFIYVKLDAGSKLELQ